MWCKNLSISYVSTFSIKITDIRSQYLNYIILNYFVIYCGINATTNKICFKIGMFND